MATWPTMIMYNLLTPEEYQTIFMLENKDRVTNSEFAADSGILVGNL